MGQGSGRGYQSATGRRYGRRHAYVGFRPKLTVSRYHHGNAVLGAEFCPERRSGDDLVAKAALFSLWRPASGSAPSCSSLTFDPRRLSLPSATPSMQCGSGAAPCGLVAIDDDRPESSDDEDGCKGLWVEEGVRSDKDEEEELEEEGAELEEGELTGRSSASSSPEEALLLWLAANSFSSSSSSDEEEVDPATQEANNDEQEVDEDDEDEGVVDGGHFVHPDLFFLDEEGGVEDEEEEAESSCSEELDADWRMLGDLAGEELMAANANAGPYVDPQLLTYLALEERLAQAMESALAHLDWLAESEQATPPASPAAIAALPRLLLPQPGLAVEPRCAICCSDFLSGELATPLPCDHVFHGDCLVTWLRKSATCPVCRRVLPETPPPNYRNRPMGSEET